MDFLKHYESVNDIVRMDVPESSFESIYIRSRSLENRIYPDKVVMQLPSLSRTQPHYREWKIRERSARRFINFIQSYSQSRRILDVGCGNGWFSHLLAKNQASEVLGIDINYTELEQAARVFKRKNLHFALHDFRVNGLPEGYFDLIVLNSVAQYFPNLENTINVLSNCATKAGEIHILDSPIYDAGEIQAARNRTKNYYISMQVPEMADYYFHHSWEDLREFPFIIRYNPHHFRNRLARFLVQESPFPWIQILKRS